MPYRSGPSLCRIYGEIARPMTTLSTTPAQFQSTPTKNRRERGTVWDAAVAMPESLMDPVSDNSPQSNATDRHSPPITGC